MKMKHNIYIWECNDNLIIWILKDSKQLSPIPWTTILDLWEPFLHFSSVIWQRVTYWDIRCILYPPLYLSYLYSSCLQFSLLLKYILIVWIACKVPTLLMSYCLGCVFIVFMFSWFYVFMLHKEFPLVGEIWTEMKLKIKVNICLVCLMSYNSTLMCQQGETGLAPLACVQRTWLSALCALCTYMILCALTLVCCTNVDSKHEPHGSDWWLMTTWRVTELNGWMSGRVQEVIDGGCVWRGGDSVLGIVWQVVSVGQNRDNYDQLGPFRA